jgi:hypothetical protein
MDQESIPNVVVAGNISRKTLIDSIRDDHLFADTSVLDGSAEEGIDDFVKH